MLVKRKKGLVVDQGTLGRTSDGWMGKRMNGM